MLLMLPAPAHHPNMSPYRILNEPGEPMVPMMISFSLPSNERKKNAKKVGIIFIYYA
jgi:hypothetical protein